MRSIVLYSSKSGNTKKLADTVYATLPEPKEICPISEMPDSMASYDLIALGFWFQGGLPDVASLEVMPTLHDKKLFLFASHGAAKNSGHAETGMKKAQELTSSCQIIGTFSCQGEVNLKVIETAKSKPEPPPWLNDAPAAIGHPNENDLLELQERITQCF